MKNIEKRISIAQKIINGDLKIRGNNIRNIIDGHYLDKPCSTTKILQNLKITKVLGKGATGEILGFAFDDVEFVIKKTKYNIGLVDEITQIPLYLGVNNPYRPENVEVEVLKLLNDLIYIKATPHIPLYMGDFVCKNLENVMTRYTIVEKASMDLYDFLEFRKKEKDINDELVRNILFQIIYTLRIIQKRFPTFRHNDLHGGNILVFLDKNWKEKKTDHYIKYTVDGNDYYVPYMGFRIALWDFDFSTINGFIENVKTEELARLHKSTQSEKNKYSDLYKVLNVLGYQLWNIKTINETKNFIKRMIPNKYLGPNVTIENIHISSEILGIIPSVHYTTPCYALKDIYFTNYKVQRPKNDVLESYSDKKVEDIKYLNRELLKIRNNYILKLDCNQYKIESGGKKPQLIPYFEYKNDAVESIKKEYDNRSECYSTKDIKPTVTLITFNNKYGPIVMDWLDEAYDSVIWEYSDFLNKKFLNKKKILSLNKLLIKYCIQYLYVPITFLQLIAIICLDQAFYYEIHYHVIGSSFMAIITDNTFSEPAVLDVITQLSRFRVVMGFENELIQKFGIDKFEDLFRE